MCYQCNETIDKYIFLNGIYIFCLFSFIRYDKVYVNSLVTCFVNDLQGYNNNQVNANVTKNVQKLKQDVNVGDAASPFSIHRFTTIFWLCDMFRIV